MKKIKINEYVFGILIFTIFMIFLGAFLTSVIAILFGEVPTKISGVKKYSFNESINTFVFSIFIGIIGYIFGKYFEPKESNKKQKIVYSICPNCKESFHYNELQDGKCPYCEDVDTIDTEKYYKEHPEEL